ncbi:hypothetical protein LUZ61_010196 [Rhynchospora tenuis]|uniref:Uncharacterized protein n=1 Tax=Rhynchospora tenuis TaxID=198213 RepID=A0AAD5ZYN1_9POAL|nr:hypothetical protein LUZ61_010196 [Rhynchospora tenuis]
MNTLSTLITSNSDKPNCSHFKTIYSTILCVATFSSLLLCRYSPLVLWFIANAIIFSVYKLSSSRHLNHSDQQADPVHPILASLRSDRWYIYPSPHHESEPTEKEVTQVNTVIEQYKKATKEKTMDDTWKTIMMRNSSAVARKPFLKKSDTWERSQQRLQRADEVGMKRELKKSATYKLRREKASAYDQQVEEKASKGDTGWRTRDALVMAQDELFKRVENFIKKQHDHLRLQRQESEHRRFLERFRK